MQPGQSAAGWDISTGHRRVSTSVAAGTPAKPKSSDQEGQRALHITQDPAHADQHSPVAPFSQHNQSSESNQSAMKEATLMLFITVAGTGLHNDLRPKWGRCSCRSCRQWSSWHWRLLWWILASNRHWAAFDPEGTDTCEKKGAGHIPVFLFG